MNLFPASPAGGVPSYLDEVRSTDKRLRYDHFAIADATRPGGRNPLINATDTGSSFGVDDGSYFVQNSNSATTGACIYAWSGDEFPPQADAFFITKLRVIDNANIRYFAGWSVKSQNDFNDTDTIADDSVGFQFSTNRGDSNWQLITNNGGTQTTTDSGLAFSTSQIYIMEIEFLGLGTSVRFRISDQNFNVLMGDTTVTSNLPAVTSDLSPISSLQTLATAAKTCRFYWRESWY